MHSRCPHRHAECLRGLSNCRTSVADGSSNFTFNFCLIVQRPSTPFGSLSAAITCASKLWSRSAEAQANGLRSKWPALCRIRARNLQEVVTNERNPIAPIDYFRAQPVVQLKRAASVPSARHEENVLVGNTFNSIMPKNVRPFLNSAQTSVSKCTHIRGQQLFPPARRHSLPPYPQNQAASADRSRHVPNRDPS